jgi:integrase
MADNLTAAKVQKLRQPGRYLDGNGLSLHVITPGPPGIGRRRWVFRYMRNGRERQLTLGDADLIKLAEARTLHTDARALLAKGIDPLDARHAHKPQAADGHRFEAVAERYVAAHEAAWKNAKHRRQWRATLATYAYPVLGAKLVHEITPNDVLAVLGPLWKQKPETASRLRGRIERVLGYAKTLGWLSGENPAQWKGNIANLLPPKGKVRRVKHHAALDWRQAPAFMRELSAGDNGMGARALRFAILTAARSGEVRGARWDEIDLDAAMWIIPAPRMKGGKPHRVPLTEPALDILRALAPLRQGSLTFPGRDGETPLSDMTLSAVLRRMQRYDLTVHGMRSCFRDWCADNGKPFDLAEAALAHVSGSEVVRAYQRSDLLEARRGLMREWAEFLTREPAVVVPLRAAGRQAPLAAP